MVRRIIFSLVGAVFLVLAAAGVAGADTTYVVRSGETLSHIAVRNGISVRSIVEANGLKDPDHIYAGQKLTLPNGSGPGPAPAPATASGTTYRVASGDTLGAIAITHGVSTKDLASLNGITNPNRIRIGQKLSIPARSVPTSSGVPGGTITTSRYGIYGSLPSVIGRDPNRAAMIEYFERWSNANGIPTDLLMSIAWHESGWNSAALSHKGAVGVGQLMPSVSTWIATDLIGRPGFDPTVAEDNIRMSARYLRWLIGYMGSEELAVAAYYQGPGSVRSQPLYSSTESYVASILAHRRLFQPDR